MTIPCFSGPIVELVPGSTYHRKCTRLYVGLRLKKRDSFFERWSPGMGGGLPSWTISCETLLPCNVCCGLACIARRGEHWHAFLGGLRPSLGHPLKPPWMDPIAIIERPPPGTASHVTLLDHSGWWDVVQFHPWGKNRRGLCGGDF